MRYKTGDKVKVRSWEDMEGEFIVDSCGDIEMPEAYFVTSMQHFCGTTIIIGRVNSGTYEMEGWSWTDDMFEHDGPSEFKEGDEVIVLNPGCCMDSSTPRGKVSRGIEADSGGMLVVKGTDDTSYYHHPSCLKLVKHEWNPQIESVLDKAKRELEELGYEHTQPGMYRTYNGPRIGEIRMSW